MKETYCISRPPEISCNGNLVVNKNSRELLSVLGFCNSETEAEQEARKAETQVRKAIEVLSSTCDDDDHMYRTLIQFPTGWDEIDLRFGVM